MSDAVICSAKHTAFQPTDDQWQCPKCGAGSESFWIEDADASSSDDCGKLHEKDTVICIQCEGGWSGQKVASILAKRLHLVTCPTCKGRGVVDGEESAP